MCQEQIGQYFYYISRQLSKRRSYFNGSCSYPKQSSLGFSLSFTTSVAVDPKDIIASPKILSPSIPTIIVTSKITETWKQNKSLARPLLTQLSCCGNYQTQSPITALMSKSQNRILSGKFTRELDKESLLNQSPIYTKHAWSVLPIFNPILMSMLCPHSCLMFYSRPLCIFHVL